MPNQHKPSCESIFSVRTWRISHRFHAAPIEVVEPHIQWFLSLTECLNQDNGNSIDQTLQYRVLWSWVHLSSSPPPLPSVSCWLSRLTKLKKYVKLLGLESALLQGHMFETIAGPIMELREKYPSASANAMHVTHGLWYVSDCLLWQLWLLLYGYWTLWIAGCHSWNPLIALSSLYDPLMEDYKYDRQSSVLILEIWVYTCRILSSIGGTSRATPSAGFVHI